MRQRYPSIVLLLAVLVLAGACSGGGGLGLGPTTPNVRVEGVENASFQLVNKERSDQAPMLSRDEQIAHYAREYSEQMRDEGFFAHTDLDGRKLRERLVAAGIEFRGAAENLAKVTNSADPASYAHTLLLQQPKHRENMLNSDYRLAGVGVAKQGDTVWITQIFVQQ